MKEILRYLRGKKTYFAVVACQVVIGLYVFHKIDVQQTLFLMSLCGGGAVMAVAAKINRVIEAMKFANNVAMRTK